MRYILWRQFWDHYFFLLCILHFSNCHETKQWESSSSNVLFANKNELSRTSSTVKRIPTAVVIGAGPAGLSVSLGLSDRGWKVILIEKYASFEVRGASFGMSENGMKALEEIHPGIVEHGMIEMGRALKLPSGGLLLPWWMMRDALLEQVIQKGGHNANTGIDLRMGLSVQHIWEKGGPGCFVQLQCTNGDIIEGDVVIGADGVHSTVREILGLPKNLLTGVKVFRGSVQVPLQTQPQIQTQTTESRSSFECPILEKLLQEGLVPLSATYPGIHFFIFNFHPHIKGRMCWVFSTTDSTFNPDQTTIQSFVEEHEKDEEKLASILAILNASSDESRSIYTETKVTDFSDHILNQYDGRWGGKVSQSYCTYPHIKQNVKLNSALFFQNS